MSTRAEDVAVDFSQPAARYVATVRLPPGILDAILANPDVCLKVSGGEEGVALHVGGDSFHVDAVCEKGDSDVLADWDDGLAMRFVGSVRERLHVMQNLGSSGSAVRRSSCQGLLFAWPSVLGSAGLQTLNASLRLHALRLLQVRAQIKNRTEQVVA